jgi:pimeloyl-ACP methyl ester carboxylesterase
MLFLLRRRTLKENIMQRQKWIVGLLIVSSVAMVSGCSWMFSLFAKAPMDVLYYPANADGEPVHNLFVFMRGIGGSNSSFEEEGLVDDVRALNLPFDMAAPNAHLGYYTGRTLIARLKADVIDPARRQGKDNIWLVGFSMGGLGSLLYLREQPDDVQGLCLVAPFLGDEDIIEEIQAAGGVRAWSPGDYDPDEDYQRMLWHWIKDNINGDAPVPIFLGCGTDDEFAPACALLAELLPEDHVVSIPGGHDYPTFKALWDRFLESGIYLP